MVLSLYIAIFVHSNICTLQLNGFSVGGVVKVIDNDKALRDLQDGHGGYNADVGKVRFCF